MNDMAVPRAHRGSPVPDAEAWPAVIGRLTVAFVAGRTSQVHERREICWSDLVEKLSSADVGDKDGPAWLPADIAPGPRTQARVEHVSALVLDVDGGEGAPAPAIADMLGELDLWGASCVLHTSYSHTPERPKFRLVFRVSRPIRSAELRRLAEHFAGALGLSGAVDTACMEPARLFYLPRCPAGRLPEFEAHEITGKPLDVDALLAEAAAIELADRAPMPISGARSGGVIQAFNEAHDITTIIERAGYERRPGDRWLWPGSETGTPGVRLLEDGRLYSSHRADPLHGEHTHDAFGCWTILLHGGNQRAAVKAAASLLGLDRTRPATSAEGRAEPLPVLEPEPIEQGLSRAAVRRPIAFQWASAIADDTEGLEEIVEDVITAGGMSVWYGEPNSGKTTLLLDLAFRMPAGLDWLGKRVTKGAVIYVALEGAGSVKRRLNAYRRHHGCEVDAFGLVSSSLNIMLPSTDLEDLLALVREKRESLPAGLLLQLIVIDTVSRALGGANENASEDMARLIAAGDLLRAETGAHIAFVHHSGKEVSKGARGHSSLKGAVDTEIEVSEEGSKLHSLTIGKQRDLGTKGMKLSSRFLPVELGANQWGKPITACVVTGRDEESPHLAAIIRRNDEESAERVVLAGFRRLRDLGIKATDGTTSKDHLPKQILEKGFGEGRSKEDLINAMNRLMGRGVFIRGPIGAYTNGTEKLGLVLTKESY